MSVSRLFHVYLVLQGMFFCACDVVFFVGKDLVSD